MLKNTTSEKSTKYYKCLCTSENYNKPYVTVNYFFNGVRGVDECSGNTTNCIGYAFKIYEPDLLKKYTTEKDKTNIIKTDSNGALKTFKKIMVLFLNDRFGKSNWREVSAYNSPLKADEWLVCMRVRVDGNNYDYHFWYRANDGK